MLFKNEVRKHQLENIAVSSVGIYAYPGTPADPNIVNYLFQIKEPVENHEARPITKEDVEWADLIFVMEKSHLKTMVSNWPKAKGKIELLGKYISQDHSADDIIDPYGKSIYHYRLAQSQITLAIESLIKRLLLDTSGSKVD